jgi:flagellar protein FlgJ
MDVIGISNNEISTFLAESQYKDAVVSNFQSVLDRAAASQASGQMTAQEDEAIREACQEFESYFLQMMFREMRKTTLNENGFLSKSYAEGIFTDMLDEEVSKSAARSGGIGLADMMYKQMTERYKSNM